MNETLSAVRHLIRVFSRQHVLFLVGVLLVHVVHAGSTGDGQPQWLGAEGFVPLSYSAETQTAPPSHESVLPFLGPVDLGGSPDARSLDEFRVQTAYLKSNNTRTDDQFGCAVAVSGDTVVVGDRFESSTTNGVNSTPVRTSKLVGAAYVFVRSGSTWVQQAYLKPPEGGLGDWFGCSVAISGDTVVVGAKHEDGSAKTVDGIPDDRATSAGAAYVFVRHGGAWTQQAYLKSSNAERGDQFGHSVAVHGDVVAVGAPYEDSSTTGVNTVADEEALGSGAVYVFRRNGSVWTQEAYLKASNAGSNDLFGWSVSIFGDGLAVGARFEDSGSTGVYSIPNDDAPDAGAAYVFSRRGSDWTQEAYVKARNAGSGDNFGISVAIGASSLIVGAQAEDGSAASSLGVPDDGVPDSGAAYVFVRSGPRWIQEAYLKSRVPSVEAGFGFSVGLWNDTIIVGSAGDDGALNGFGGVDSGSAEIFKYAENSWSSRAYVKAGNGGSGDYFGYSTAVDTGLIVVGAIGESSSTTGINSVPDDSAPKAGAAYIFELVVPEPEMEVAQPAGVEVLTGATRGFGAAVVGESQELVFAVGNLGTAELMLTGEPRVGIAGPDAGMFSVVAQPGAASVGPGGSVGFTVRFSPVSGGVKSAVLSIPNNDADEAAFSIALIGAGVSFTDDTDGDGLNDASEFKMSALGFNWLVPQPGLVSALFENAAGAGLCPVEQVKALRIGTPLLVRDPATGEITIEIGLEKSTDMKSYTPVPFAAPQTAVRPDGKLEFRFSSPPAASFFRLQAR